MAETGSWPKIFEYIRLLTRRILPVVAAAILAAALVWVMKNKLPYFTAGSAVTDTLITGGEQLPAQVFAVALIIPTK